MDVHDARVLYYRSDRAHAPCKVEHLFNKPGINYLSGQVSLHQIHDKHTNRSINVISGCVQTGPAAALFIYFSAFEAGIADAITSFK